MNQEIKAEWVAALRSGDYRQGKFSLRPGGDCFCCMGVLTDLYFKARGVEDWGDEELKGVSINNSDPGHLPSAVQEWSGSSGDPVVLSTAADKRFPRHSLSTLNDHCDHDFLDIATLIEEQL